MAVLRIFSVAVLAASTLLLSGCPGNAPATSPAAKTAQSTAPALAGPRTTGPTGPAHSPELAVAAPVAQVHPERDRSLIASVEKAYQAGITNYRDGHLEAARANFDYAVDLMLTSGLDLKNDPALSSEFDHIVDAVNTLEMDALRSGTALTAQQHQEQAPVDVANDVTFAVDPRIKAQAQAELKTTQSDLPLVINDYVAAYINFFSNTARGHNTIVNSLTRAGRYKAMIQRVLREEGVPQDLIYQAVAESGFRPQAINPHSGAGGMWQFMPYGDYGLARNGWYDERLDPEKATRAYANEIKKMYAQFGDWYLAMAAYDWGAGNVQRAVQRTGYADFWELYRRNNLPQETKNYVPIILAVTIMAKNPAQYGLSGMVPDPPELVDTVMTDYAVDLRLVADVVNAPVEEIVALNPSLLRMSTPPNDPFDLHLPAGTKALYMLRIAEVPEDKRRSWRFHVLAPGDTLASVARQYRVSEKAIAFVNQLGSAPDLANTDSLVIPLAPASAPSRTNLATYRIRRGDTLVTVADRFGVTVAELRRWNHLASTSIEPGHRLYVAEPARISSHGHGAGHARHATATLHSATHKRGAQ